MIKAMTVHVKRINTFKGSDMKYSFAFNEARENNRSVTMCIGSAEDEATGYVGMTMPTIAIKRPTENYSKRTGKKCALKRMLERMGLDKVERTIVWDKFNYTYPIKRKKR
jgi:hypothetical protein